MVNTEEFTKRLHRIMNFYDLSAASFADRIDVGRSSISHLLSGRNKPSLDFVMKIVKAFPEVELYWLLNGKGEFPNTTTPSPQESNASSGSFSTEKNIPKEPDKDAEGPAQRKKAIEKIVIFYRDGSFDAFEN